MAARKPLWSHGWALALLVLASAGVAADSALAETLSYQAVLKQLSDLDRLMEYEPGVFAGQCSSYSRDEYVAWATNADSGHYLRVEETGEGVLMDQDGPGCIVRIWSANPTGRIRVCLDGAENPTFEWDFASLFTGDQYPFIEPLVYRRDPSTRMSASDCYVPIPFARHIKVTSVGAEPQFYIINYLTYPAEWTVETFHLPLSQAEREALRAAADVWSRPGQDPKPIWAGQASLRRRVVIEPGETVSMARLSGGGVIRAVRASLSTEQRYAWRKMVVRGAWDGASWPQILTPLGGLFGFDWDPVEYASLIAGYRDGQGYFYYPMPFRRSAEFTVTSYLEVPAEVSFEVEWAPMAQTPPNMLYFFARWRHERDSTSLDYRLLETAGQGHYVGTALSVDHPIPGWWGEGDEKVWVDDDRFPRWIGTGSEDYFGDAWGIRYLSEPSFGCTVDTETRTAPYRWHLMDRIPFTKRLRMTIENYGPWFNIEHDEYEYSSVAFWYQRELVPPYGLLAGESYMGGTQYLQTPAEYPFDPSSLWTELDGAELRTTGRSIPWALEAEDLLRGDGTLVSDAARPYEYSAERAVAYTEGPTESREFRLAAESGGVYDLLLYTDPSDTACPVRLVLGGEIIEAVQCVEPGVFDLGAVSLTKAGSKGAFQVTGRDGAILDCLQLRPAVKAENALEAEDLSVIRTRGNVEVYPSPAARGPSAGRYLEVRAKSPDSGVVLPVIAGRTADYVLGVRAMVGPQSGIIQAFVDGKAIGPAWDLYQEGELQPGGVYPLGLLPRTAQEVELRLVGTNPASGAYYAGLDYFTWLPLIIHPESDEGVTARVTATHGCQVRTQDLGDRFVGGHHLWVQPSSRGAYVDITLEVPETAEYILQMRYTTSWDYAIVQSSLDGQPLGAPIDLYSEEVELTEPLTYGPVPLEAGSHVLRLQAVDRNPASAEGYLMGLDYLLVRRR